LKGEVEHFFLEASREKERTRGVRKKQNKIRNLSSRRTKSSGSAVTK
jgi:hypothetical protein